MVAPYAHPEKGAAVVRVNSFGNYFQAMGHKVTTLAPVRQGIEQQGNVVRYSGMMGLIELLLKADFDIMIGTTPPIAPAFFAIICIISPLPMKANK